MPIFRPLCRLALRRITIVLLSGPTVLCGCGSLGPAAMSGIQPGMTAGLAAAPEATAAPAAEPIATIQPGDSHLTCDVVSAQMSQMDQIAAEKMDNGVSAISYIPIVGDIATLADINAHAARLQDEANRKNQAYQRKQYLVQLSGRLGC